MTSSGLPVAPSALLFHLAKSRELLRAAQEQFRLRNTEATIALLTQAEARFMRAEEALARTPETAIPTVYERFRVARKEFDEFRTSINEP
jgi:hypothetical protein